MIENPQACLGMFLTQFYFYCFWKQISVGELNSNKMKEEKKMMEDLGLELGLPNSLPTSENT